MRRPKPPPQTLTPAGDLHADDAYRRDLAATLTSRVLRIACARAGHSLDG